VTARTKARLAYGSRGPSPAAGIRSVATTFGKVRITGFSIKTAYGDMELDGPAELLVADLLTLDPNVRQYKGQPFTVDLIDRRILRTGEAVAAARKKHRLLEGPKFYTPDFEVDCFEGSPFAVEAKLEGYTGNDDYARKLARGKELIEASGYQFLHLVMPSNAWHPLRLNLGSLALAAMRKDLWPSAAQAEAVRQVCGNKGCSVRQLCATLDLSPDLVPAWLVSGVLAADLSRQPINFDLHVTSALGDLSHLAMLKEFAS